MKKQDKGHRDTPTSRVPSREYLSNWEAIFDKKLPNGNNEQTAQLENK